MINIQEKAQCNGCRVCGDICPANAISFKADILDGFAYPVVDATRCVDCHLCEIKCAQAQEYLHVNRLEPEVYAAWSNDDEKRLLCTSGGMFWELAKWIVENGGAVIACRYTDDYRGAYHDIATSLEDLIPLCGSKHVQSDTTGIFSRTKSALNSFPYVLFVGSPCQVAALYLFLGNEPENLYTADFICNSINSPKAQAKYIDQLASDYGSKVVFSRAKDKRFGWNNFGSSARFENGQEYYASRDEDLRVVGYHKGHLFVRSSCYECKYKRIPRNADVTLADFWGIKPDERNPKMEEGTSLVMINSQKGKDFFDKVSTHIGFYKKDFESALAGNPAILKSAQASGRSEAAFAALATENFRTVVNKYYLKDSLITRIKKYVKKIIREGLNI